MESEPCDLGIPENVRRVVNNFAARVTEAYSGFLAGTEPAASAIIDQLIRDYGAAFMGRDARYQIRPWQGARMQGKLVATIPKMTWDDDPGEAVFRFVALLCVKSCLALSDGHPDQRVGRDLRTALNDVMDVILAPPASFRRN